MTRYSFNLRTRAGQRVENISILAPTRSDAERRLRQMYQHCEMVGGHQTTVPRRGDTLDVEALIELISGSEPPSQRPRPASHHAPPSTGSSSSSSAV